MQASPRGPNWFTNFAKMKMSDKRKFVVAPKSREIGPHVVGVKICVTKSWPVTAPGSQGVFRGRGRGFGFLKKWAPGSYCLELVVACPAAGTSALILLVEGK
jgi:hypothetical protein